MASHSNFTSSTLSIRSAHNGMCLFGTRGLFWF